MNFVRCIGEGIIFSIILGAVSKHKPSLRSAAAVSFVVIEIVSVYFLYRGQENTLFFFLHPFIAFMLTDISDYAVYKRDNFEKLVIWPLFVVPLMSSFVFAMSWIWKIDAIGEFFRTI